MSQAHTHTCAHTHAHTHTHHSHIHRHVKPLMLECRCTEHNLHNNIDKLIILLHNLKLHVFTVIYTHYVIIIQNQTKPLIYLMIIILNTQQAHCESVNGYSLWPPLTQFIQL